MDKVALALSATAMASVGALIGSVLPLSGRASEVTARPINFTLCHAGGGFNCVVDGDTVWINGTKVRIADIDAPETHPSRCSQEAKLGSEATRRLRELLNLGPFEMRASGKDEDRFGRKLRILTRNGRSIGGMLVNEGLARWYQGHRQPWC